MMHSYEFRLALFLSGVGFIVFSKYDPSLATGTVCVLAILASHAVCSFFDSPYLFSSLPMNEQVRSDYFEFRDQYYTAKNLYTHPLTILSGLLVYWNGEHIVEKLASFGWSSSLYVLVLLALLFAMPARLWGFPGSMIIEYLEEKGERQLLGSAMGDYDGE
ncbi:hypothetical protein A3I99_02390 [Candidatus Kaiserbacteria bacterium RIFCSPLOWO2_02_FULL_45_11b]|uniref:Uncharacterized protein n=1 Tax=Candidatus Kaiserbacteria bacterium RIFCSPLOWO2_12_FULL_45_26 TaxID=1798525 RepID=A0A1F6FF69_9BACT|nr:MAG: hypothetical protein A2Z56_01580 [Candidatus Kaiserbacteria bacterium RIFCSPHIGHO2_12_45_16]OGG70237.1 MAG: hypothetical protein A2929_04135 [Candidatus Kaiserbacteria bacterium RIFCSPLOWO2_01_FULL_45_25]OGG81905.1 MAG: hypothetical protein A3I99_02390 [Candidatus Kaiserbacteria bacterium RIFCSPLOWO2_02_FULL_45_11b]OGG84500.1 MAG: hypothetical protein A3G90_00180 [Candidatus Kaiserbacteria bacterium RIFCSPLOWO2_12_FULL_45_26]